MVATIKLGDSGAGLVEVGEGHFLKQEREHNRKRTK